MMPFARYFCIFINVGLGEARFSGRLLNTNIFKSSGKYIPTPGTKKIRVIASGGGGGGGGVPETTANQQATAGAGLSGAFIEAFFEVDNDFEVNVIIGAAGKGGEPEEIQVVKVAQLISVP
ncbi:phage tail protein [Escherichia coli]|nr:phage tail protein [Escherichia coli]